MADPICSVFGCEKPVTRRRRRGLCIMHAERLRLHGAFDLPPTPTVEERFWSKVAVAGPSECWPWKASVTGNSGYGTLKDAGREVKAHRFSYELHHGPIPEGLVVRHDCDVRHCVNPAHLRIGTPLDNVQDMVDRGRACKGEAKPSAKLTEADVRHIRALVSAGRGHREVARMYGMSHRTIGDIVHHRKWKHVA